MVAGQLVLGSAPADKRIHIACAPALVSNQMLVIHAMNVAGASDAIARTHAQCVCASH